MRQKTSAFRPFIYFAASSAAASAADQVAAADEATATDAAETAAGFPDSNPRFCDRRQVCHTHTLNCTVSFCAYPFLIRSDLSYCMFMSSSPSLLAAGPLPEPFATSITFLCPPLPFFEQIYHF